MAQAFHAVVHGLVQGVSFRYHTRVRASELGLSGWVRNRPDGSVEVYAEGRSEALSELAAWLLRGPSFARVDRVDTTPAEPTGRKDGFAITF